MTSLAEDELANIRDGVYIPRSILPITEGGLLIDEGDDNDISYQTIYGKNTFHSMARVVFQVRPSDTPVPERSIRVVRRTNQCLPLTHKGLFLQHKYCKRPNIGLP